MNGEKAQGVCFLTTHSSASVKEAQKIPSAHVPYVKGTSTPKWAWGFVKALPFSLAIKWACCLLSNVGIVAIVKYNALTCSVH